jgi:hypothetical protein
VQAANAAVADAFIASASARATIATTVAARRRSISTRSSRAATALTMNYCGGVPGEGSASLRSAPRMTSAKAGRPSASSSD